MTDTSGQYAIPSIPPGSYTVIAQAEGFETAEQGPIELKAGDDLELDDLLLEPIRNYPEVLQTEPKNGARDVQIKREIPITIRFSKKMAPESLRQAIRIEPQVAFRVYAGRELPDLDFDLVRIILSGAIEEPVAQFRTRYTITIADTASDFEGLTLQEPFKMSFTTGSPAVISTQPANNEVKPTINIAEPVAVYFNAPMDHASLTMAALRIQPAPSETPTLYIQEDPLTGWTRLYIASNLRPDTEYRITVNQRARTVGKNSLSNTPYTFKFRTAKLYQFRLPGSTQAAPR